MKTGIVRVEKMVMELDALQQKTKTMMVLVRLISLKIIIIIYNENYKN